jgi:hypothetical protein
VVEHVSVQLCGQWVQIDHIWRLWQSIRSSVSNQRLALVGMGNFFCDIYFVEIVLILKLLVWLTFGCRAGHHHNIAQNLACSLEYF